MWDVFHSLSTATAAPTLGRCLRAKCAKPADGFLFLGGELGRDIHADVNHEVSPPSSVEATHAAAGNPHHRARLGAAWNIKHHRFTIDERYLHLRSKYGFTDPNCQAVPQVVSVSLEPGVGGHRHLNVQIAGAGAGRAGPTLPSQTQTRSGVHSRRYANGELPALVNQLSPSAGRARLTHHFAPAVTMVTSLKRGHRSEHGSARYLDGPLPAAPGACFGIGARGGTGCPAGRARLWCAEGELSVDSNRSLGQGNLGGHKQVLTCPLLGL